MSNYIQIYENAMTNEFCDSLVEFYKNNPNLVQRFDHEWRRSSSLPLYNNLPSELFNNMKDNIRTHLEKYKKDIGDSAGAGTLHFCTLLEAPNLLCYDNTSDKPEHFHTHSDNWSIQSSTRQVSVIMYLNDVEEGGNTVFPFYNLSVKPKKGTILMFPAFFCFSHYAEKPKSNTKFAIVTWVHFGGGNTSYFTLPF
ncbi:2OG-FeII oxygenase superfamily protein [Catovirus CTV1]|uniref:2OG-FeII oxygenase superfamily protein n=1 Tax=Catovirus CTV1 TaxID=1977631 RepID=A0A1V0S9A8_9VIRU|nr:2OG-FeII oxygenase superfamily protein [Catovirus CTV1]